VIPDKSTEIRILREISQACERLVEQVSERIARHGPMSGPALSHFASAALERYVEAILRPLLSATSGTPGGPADEWVTGQFHAGLELAGGALRTTLAESQLRHAVAQSLQRKMFEAESMLRRALKGRQPASLSGRRPTTPDAEPQEQVSVAKSGR
jgi:hypothetical protein